MNRWSRRRAAWSPFDKRGHLRLVLATDPWWKRLRAKLLGQPVWYQTGAMRQEDQ